ncbi:hypothetical protein LEQ04_02545 [Riemerella anatipestifer]|nr:hypothetical protein LEQ05_07050 [Riemerella anatipestifer]WPC12344.1 hypothetical protein LEQ03_08585 [Riemerella anatipestifer]WPC15805.1 hypothetical protein LEQ04_02545 [Riemerella anatipestifer]
MEGVKLVIKQGFNFVPSVNGQNNIVPANDSEQQLKKFLVMRSDSINAHKKETEQIFKELKVQNNNIKKFAFSTMDEVTDSSIIKKNVMLITVGESIREVEKIKINEWLKVRVNNPKLEVIYNIK